MIFTIILKILAHRYYQSNLYNDYYNEYSVVEKEELKTEIFKNLDNNLIILLTNNGEYNGKAKVLNTYLYEDNNTLYIKTILDMTNPDNYTAKKIINIIYDTNEHYYRAGPVGEYGPLYYYKNMNENKDIDPTFDQIILCTKNDNGSKFGKYEYTWVVKSIDVDDLNESGTNISQLKRKCENCNYYVYYYEDNTMHNLFSSACLGNSGKKYNVEELEKMADKMYGSPIYYRITDNKHNLLFDKCY